MNLFSEYFKKITKQELACLFFRLSTLLEAGIPLIHALTVLSQDQKSSVKIILKSIIMQLKLGKSLSASLRKHPHYFNLFVCSLVVIGEKTGKLDEMFKRISNHQEKQNALSKKIKNALFYPSFVVISALTLTLTMIIFIVPRFAELFASFHHPLPVITRFFIDLSSILKNNIMLITYPFYLIPLFYFYKPPRRMKFFIAHLTTKIPFVKTIYPKILLMHFAQTLAIQLAAGIPITECLKILGPLHKNLLYQNALKKLQTQIAIGQSLYHSMVKTNYFPPLLLQMIKVGEESGTLERMLEKVAAIYDAEVTDSINKFTQLLEPLIIIGLGVLIGCLVIAMYLPIVELETVI